ncbi:MAG: hypothetical protein KY475_25335, partial [Planctomycetes bacterium]|nr:hypothetical protein [Planctomycetota bacterium]
YCNTNSSPAFQIAQLQNARAREFADETLASRSVTLRATTGVDVDRLNLSTSTLLADGMSTLFVEAILSLFQRSVAEKNFSWGRRGALMLCLAVSCGDDRSWKKRRLCTEIDEFVTNY